MDESTELAAAGRKAPVANDDPAVAAAFLAHRDEPIERFRGLLAHARTDPRIREATAMALATVGDDGRPSSRIMLLKGVDADGFVFYTNLDSRKGREARAHPDVALTFHWQPLEIQVRVEGRAQLVDDAEADAYFAGRPRGSQLGAWASHQSGVLASRAELEERLAEVTRRFEGRPVPRPPRWSGFRVPPLSLEFWRNRESRLHDRERYTRARPGAPWRLELLNP
jgi:pyridoxamine 5'-phosphate oxidase